MIIFLAGEIAAGKSVTAITLAEAINARIISVRGALAETLGVSPYDRRALQVGGAELDRRTAGRWLLEHVIEAHDEGSLVVDSVRTRRQALPLLEHLESAHLVYLAAHDSTRRQRYRAALRTDRLKSSISFDQASAHATEREVRTLRAVAGVVIDTDDVTPQTVAREVLDQISRTGTGSPSRLPAQPAP